MTSPLRAARVTAIAKARYDRRFGDGAWDIIQGLETAEHTRLIFKESSRLDLRAADAVLAEWREELAELVSHYLDGRDLWHRHQASNELADAVIEWITE